MINQRDRKKRNTDDRIDRISGIKKVSHRWHWAVDIPVDRDGGAACCRGLKTLWRRGRRHPNLQPKNPYNPFNR